MKNFKSLNLNNKFVENLSNRGIQEPTPIQEASIPTLIEGKDLIGQAKTGSGKTLAFLLPLFENIKLNVNEIQGLILTPTRELALQITKEAEKLCVEKDIKPLLVYGGQDIDKQIKQIKDAKLIIATPGRLIDHLNRGTIKLNKLKHVVLDEADQMLLMGFKNEVEAIMSKSSKKKQMAFFSATMDSNVKKMAYRYTTEPVVIEIKEDSANDNIEHYLVETTDRWKIDALCETLNKENPFMGIIFCRTKARVDKLDDRLTERGYNCHKIHSDIPQSKREKIMASFKKAEIQYLIATDVASRGIHVDGVTHVFNYDISEDKEGFIHRVGRTGRAGEKGKAFLFTTPKNEDMLDSIRRDINFEKVELEELKEVRSTNPLPTGKYKKKITAKPRKFKK